MNMPTAKPDLEAYRRRWRAVAEFEREEQRRTSPAERWHALNALVRLAAALGLADDAPARTNRTSREETAVESAHIPTPLLAPIQAVQRLIERFDNRGIVIGGVAASLLGRPRLTADVHAMLLLDVDDVPRLIRYARAEDLLPRLPDVEAFAQRTHVVLLRHEASGIDVDVSLGQLPFEVEAVARSRTHTLGSLRLRLPTPEDLVVFKAVAHRPKDMLDIEAVIAATERLDTDYVALRVRRLAAALETPEIWTDLEALLQQAR